jgi:hypothetical protein
MEAAPRPDGDDVFIDAEMPTPGDEPAEEIAERPHRLPVPEFFSRRAFHSKDTGRWHRRTGGRDGNPDEPRK